jgi:hypothetical protein
VSQQPAAAAVHRRPRRMPHRLLEHRHVAEVLGDNRARLLTDANG